MLHLCAPSAQRPAHRVGAAVAAVTAVTAVTDVTDVTQSHSSWAQAASISDSRGCNSCREEVNHSIRFPSEYQVSEGMASRRVRANSGDRQCKMLLKVTRRHVASKGALQWRSKITNRREERGGWSTFNKWIERELRSFLKEDWKPFRDTGSHLNKAMRWWLSWGDLGLRNIQIRGPSAPLFASHLTGNSDSFPQDLAHGDRNLALDSSIERNPGKACSLSPASLISAPNCLSIGGYPDFEWAEKKKFHIRLLSQRKSMHKRIWQEMRQSKETTVSS
jgi:hypothetical protein